MYTIEQKREMRLKFWSNFRNFSSRRRRSRRMPARWVGDNTGIRHLKLKFHFDEERAMVCIDIVAKDLDRRVELYDRLEGLRKLLEDSVGEPMVWELQYNYNNQPEISRVYLQMEGVNIYDPNCWPDVMVFFFNKMIRIEPLILEYREYLDGVRG